MNARAEVLNSSCALHRLALAALAQQLDGDNAEAQAQWLRSQSLDVPVPQALSAWFSAPPASDLPLAGLAAELQLSLPELLAVALASAVETDAMLGRVVAWLQAPLGAARPTLGLLMQLLAALGEAPAWQTLLDGPAHSLGLLQVDISSSGVLPEATLQVPLTLALALQGQLARWPGMRWQPEAAVALAASCCAQAQTQAQALAQSHGGCLLIRASHSSEAQAAAYLVTQALGRPAAFFSGPAPAGLGPWLRLVGALPVLNLEPGPGEHLPLPELLGYDGPVLVCSGLDGGLDTGLRGLSTWRLELPLPAERAALWQQVGVAPALANELAQRHRLGAAELVALAHSAHHHARLAGARTLAAVHVRAATRAGRGQQLGALAEQLPDHIADETLVLPPHLRASLLALAERCRLREGLASTLGTASRQRYSASVRALFVGPSGTGKTLAAGWLASRLGLPLFRVDGAALASKYIGETEKNLAQLFARAEASELVLLFDEADALFGKRVEQRDSNDRFANAQSNYLLQRIESFQGIAVLTSNSRSRFDTAFTRRLDSILDFPMPTPEERRALWAAHLGPEQALPDAELNRLVAACDLAGGHVRNAVFAAAARAGGPGGRRIGWADLALAAGAEYKKLARPAPPGLLDLGAGP